MWKKQVARVLGGCIFSACLGMVMGGQNVSAASTDDEFIKGMDLSSLEAEEDAGVTFYDESGNEITDILTYLAEEKEVNYVRLRVWNNPTTSFDGGDYCNEEHTVEMAKRVKEAGMKLLIDFHYSDSWADPATQTKPAEWEDLSYDDLVDAVYDYTAEVLNALDEVDAYPDMVQIGNEISGGILWQDGYIDNMSNLAELLNSGISAVRDTTPDGQETKIMLHLAEGGDSDRFEYFFDNIIANGVTDFDVVGMSYYAYWHGSLNALKENMNNIVERYGKEVVVAETSYPYTYDDADDTENQIGESDTDVAGLEASVENQKLMTEMTFNTVANVDDDMGLGVFYWEPLWVAVDGVGVTKGEGNEWDNQILFDADGVALDSLNAFQFDADEVSSNNSKDVIVYSPDDQIVQVDDYDDLTDALPTTVDVLTYDGDMVELPVTWTGASDVDTSVVADYTFSGVVSNTDPLDGVTLAVPTINVSVQRNLVKNASFEDCENTTDWTINMITGSAGKITDGTDSYAYTGDGSFQYWYDDDFCTEITQTVDVTAGHTYDFSVWAQGTWDYIDYDESYFFVKYYDASGNEVTLDTVELLNANYSWWNQFEMEGITIPDGIDQVIIGGRVTGTANGYGTWDDFRLVDEDSTAVVEDRNYLENGDFEATSTSGSTTYASMEDWDVSVTGTWPDTAWANTNQNHTTDGAYAFNYYGSSAFNVTLSQTVSDLTAGTYELSLYSYGSSDAKTVTVKVISGSTTYTQNITDTASWNSSTSAPNWLEINLDDIAVSDGSVTVQIVIDGVAGSWGYLDDVSLERQ